MRSLILIGFMLAASLVHAGEFIIRLTAPAYAGKMVVLSRYDDLFTLRTLRLAQEPVSDTVVLRGEVEGTQKMQLRIGEAIGDLYVRDGSELNIIFPKADAGTARSFNMTTRVPLEFTEISPLDINALVTDLNERIDAFVAEDLATDEAAGMRAVERVRQEGVREPAETTQRPPTIFLDPKWSKARIDTFATKLQRFYAEVDDPWFKSYLEYSIAGLELGPRTDDRQWWEKYLKDRLVQHDVPEYVRSVRSFFEGHFAMLAAMHKTRFDGAMNSASMDSLQALMSINDFLKDDPVLRELVMLDQLYVHYNDRFIRKDAARKMLQEVASRSVTPAHQRIATNMLWDLTAMRPGSKLPPMKLEDLKGDPIDTSGFSKGPLVIAVTASWCTYCQLEIAALERLSEEYDGVIPIVAISLDTALTDLQRYVQGRPQKIRWLHAEAEQRLRDDLRIRSLPAFFIMQDGVLTHSPAPAPSAGMAAIFYRAKVQMEKEGRIKVWDE